MLLRSSGRVRVPIRGVTEPGVCTLLDSCSVSGTLQLRPVPRHVYAELTAIGPARRPYGDFLAALGLRRRGQIGGIRVTGAVSWDDRGVLDESLGGCSNAGPLEAGSVNLDGNGGALDASYRPGITLRTRCPGPILGTDTTALSGRLPRAELRHSVFTIVLGRSAPFIDDGYVGQFGGVLSFTLRHGHVSSQFIKAPSL
jgi:hypothetical protein